ncbi:RNase adapter RapZ [Williamsia sp. CHRR-6]|uniref:RNase adapter RapZ n=1 Tax=Williamsia sp. CHRR-6 TaxID=2835871 RepID=UPI001BDAF3F5|nr:RNase adapter RapZ [Williamsia sp. CHRR-6]MBT0568031.1 RNase adapter RapZ [Williamsia sp. CHRR-6]
MSGPDTDTSATESDAQESDAQESDAAESGTESGGPVDVLLVTGMSGAGRGTVAKLLEDLGWYVADNVPGSMIASMVEVTRADDPSMTRIAVVMRASANAFATATAFAAEVADVRRDLEAGGRAPRLLFLDADDGALVRRFEQVRRRHPLQDNGTLIDGISRERAVLGPVAEQADLVVDTSVLSVTALREIIDNAFAQPATTRVRITVESFGFKYGLPIDADLVADMRFLPNPYWVPELRDLDGRDDAVADYVLGQDGAQDYLAAYEQLIRLTARGYHREGKRYMTVAIGCTGGKHRSVAMAEEMRRRLRGRDGAAVLDDAVDDAPVRVVHRDLGRE